MNFYFTYYILGFIMLPGIILGIWAQAKVYSTFSKYNSVPTTKNIPANQFAKKMLAYGGCTNTNVTLISGELTDNYNPSTDTISLSQTVYNSSSIASIGVTAHEIGHVFQHHSNYTPIKIRAGVAKIVNISNFLVWPLIILGLIFEFVFYTTSVNVFLYIGIGLYAFNTLFCLVTLPVEINASKRAYDMLVSTGEMSAEEAKGVKKVLTAAAWTYVASLITSILSLLRLILTLASIKRN